MTTKDEISEKLRTAHPHWPAEKVEWIALQALGVLAMRERRR